MDHVIIRLSTQGCQKSSLTHYQTTNFKLFQTERVCRQQFQVRRKWQKVIQTGRKHSGKRRNCSLQAISPFPTVFSKGLLPRGVKRCHCVGMGQEVKVFGVPQSGPNVHTATLNPSLLPESVIFSYLISLYVQLLSSAQNEYHLYPISHHHLLPHNMPTTKLTRVCHSM